MTETVVVNFFAGPGTGKSTTAAGVFAKLKQDGINAEIVHEFAKDLTWEKRDGALKYQPYVLGKQSYHVHRLLGQVDVVVTDSPILLCGCIYGRGLPYKDTTSRLALDIFRSWNCYNIFLKRSKDRVYNPAGRNQTESEAAEVDYQIEWMLREHKIPFDVFAVKDGDRTQREIVEAIKKSHFTEF